MKPLCKRFIAHHPISTHKKKYRTLLLLLICALTPQVYASEQSYWPTEQRREIRDPSYTLSIVDFWNINNPQSKYFYQHRGIPNGVSNFEYFKTSFDLLEKYGAYLPEAIGKNWLIKNGVYGFPRKLWWTIMSYIPIRVAFGPIHMLDDELSRSIKLEKDIYGERLLKIIDQPDVWHIDIDHRGLGPITLAPSVTPEEIEIVKRFMLDRCKIDLDKHLNVIQCVFLMKALLSSKTKDEALNTSLVVFPAKVKKMRKLANQMVYKTKAEYRARIFSLEQQLGCGSIDNEYWVFIYPSQPTTDDWLCIKEMRNYKERSKDLNIRKGWLVRLRTPQEIVELFPAILYPIINRRLLKVLDGPEAIRKARQNHVWRLEKGNALCKGLSSCWTMRKKVNPKNHTATHFCYHLRKNPNQDAISALSFQLKLKNLATYGYTKFEDVCENWLRESGVLLSKDVIELIIRYINVDAVIDDVKINFDAPNTRMLRTIEFYYSRRSKCTIPLLVKRCLITYNGKANTSKIELPRLIQLKFKGFFKILNLNIDVDKFPNLVACILNIPYKSLRNISSGTLKKNPKYKHVYLPIRLSQD